MNIRKEVSVYFLVETKHRMDSEVEGFFVLKTFLWLEVLFMGGQNLRVLGWELGKFVVCNYIQCMML